MKCRCRKLCRTIVTPRKASFCNFECGYTSNCRVRCGSVCRLRSNAAFTAKYSDGHEFDCFQTMCL